MEVGPAAELVISATESWSWLVVTEVGSKAKAGSW